MSGRLRNRKLDFKISSGTPCWKIYLVIFPAAYSRYKYLQEDSFARHHYFLIVYKIRQSKHLSFYHKLKVSCATIERGSTRRKTRGQYKKTWKLFHLTSWNQTGDPRSVQTGGAVVEIGVEAGGRLGWP
jgi:hypothetical protein